jgi:hypothetical protein
MNKAQVPARDLGFCGFGRGYQLVMEPSVR